MNLLPGFSTVGCCFNEASTRHFLLARWGSGAFKPIDFHSSYRDRDAVKSRQYYTNPTLDVLTLLLS